MSKDKYMDNSNKKKADQLGMPHGTASNRLRKAIIFTLLKESNKNFCFQCGGEIISEKELSIEHKVPYLDSENPKFLFFDINNIAFSHLSCNISAARPRKMAEHGHRAYRKGCRCDTCRKMKSEMQARWKDRKNAPVV